MDANQKHLIGRAEQLGELAGDRWVTRAWLKSMAPTACFARILSLAIELDILQTMDIVSVGEGRTAYRKYRSGHAQIDGLSVAFLLAFLWPLFLFGETWGFPLAYAWCSFLLLVACAVVVAFAAWTARLFKKGPRK